MVEGTLRRVVAGTLLVGGIETDQRITDTIP